ncbi:hypothetical protein ACLB2K_021322 [Fragaria x ananassa]
MERDRNPATERKFSETTVSSSDDDNLPLSKRAKRLAAKRSSSTNERNPATSQRKFSEVSESSSDDDLQLLERKKKFSSIKDTNPATKRKGSEDSVSSDDDLRQSKRTKRLSSTNDRNPATSKRKLSEVSESSSDDDLPLSTRKKRLSSINDRNPATSSKRNFDDDLRQSKRLVPKRVSSTTIHDIPEELLVEILCRLPCAKYVFRCKSVSKSWRSLTSDPNFVGRFLWLQRQNQTLIPGTIINRWGYELLTTDLFKRLRSFKTKEIKKLEVLATWNDLVLCRRLYYEIVDGEDHICKRFCRHDDGQYYICNPRTSMQLVNLPWIHECGLRCDPFVGFMCEPYYKEEEDDRHANNSTDETEGEKRKVIRIDAEYKFKVVRILPPEDPYSPCFEFKIQVFSNDIEEDGDLLGLGPLMINNKSTPTCFNSTSVDGDWGYQFHVIELARQERQNEDLPCSSYHLQAHRGRLQLVQMVGNENKIGARLFVWELKKEELEQMAVQGGGELSHKHRNIYAIIDGVRCDTRYSLEYFGSHPIYLDTCFLSRTDYTRSEKKPRSKKKHIDDDDDDYTFIYKCNIQTGECSEMDMDETFDGKGLQIMLPWWPTPLPTIRSHTAETSS